MFKIESNYITVDRTFASEDEAREYAIEQMERYIHDWIEEFVEFETVGIADDPEAFIEAVRDGEIDNYDIADALQDYVDQVRFDKGAQLERIRGLLTRQAELESKAADLQEQLDQLRQDNQEAQS